MDKDALVVAEIAEFVRFDFVFLGSVRPTFIVLIVLPLAVLGAFIGLYFTHQTINIMTLGGLALVIGLLIDESIVVLENTQRHLAMGKTPQQAALDGAGEVTRPLTIVTVTICVVFFPIIFLSGMGKFLFTPLAMTVIFAICTSRLLATTLVPVCAAKFLRSRSARLSPAAAAPQRQRRQKFRRTQWSSRTLRLGTAALRKNTTMAGSHMFAGVTSVY